MGAVQGLPAGISEDLRRAVDLLKAAGCAEVYLFGSLAHGEGQEDSELDLAVRGCPRGEFFHVFGRLLMELERPVDLISLDWQRDLAEYLEAGRELVRLD